MKVNLVPVVIVALLSIGCGDSGYGTFEGSIGSGPECAREFLPFESSFQTARVNESSISFLFQSDGGNPEGKDIVMLVTRSPDAFSVGESYELGPPLTTDGFSGQVSLGSSCEDPIPLSLTGTVSFTQFDDESGATVAGALSDASLINDSTGEALATGVSGSWEFIYETGPPYEAYP